MVLDFALVILVFSILLTVYRVLKGPSWGDRITALDFLGVNFSVLVVLFVLRTGLMQFLDAALILGILGFISTVAMSLYLLRGWVIR